MQDLENEDDPLGLAAACYKRGPGFSDAQWAIFDSAQNAAARKDEAAELKLRNAIQGLEAGKLSSEQRKTIRKFESEFGAGAGTLENMKFIADNYAKSVKVLRDQSDFVAVGHSGGDYLKLNGGSATGMAGVDPNDPKTLHVNVNHQQFARNEPLAVWALGHEPLHAEGILLTDQVGPNGARAYKYGPPANRDAFYALKKDLQKSLLNPDHITSFAQGEIDETSDPDAWRRAGAGRLRGPAGPGN